MKIITRDELSPELLVELRNSIFVYPTDTIYGIGCDATNEELVGRIRKLKRRFDNPFSVIVPNKEVVRDHCVVPSYGEEWLGKLPGPFTLVFPLKDSFVASNVSPGNASVGVRMLGNWFQDVVQKLGVPVVTTSVNVTGNQFMKSLNDIDPEVAVGVDFAIDDGELSGAPSTVVLLTGDEPKVISRG